jgi:hypothetical protein
MLGLPADLLLQPSAYQLPALSVKHSLRNRATSMRRLQSSALFRLTLRGGAGAALTGSYMERRSRSALAAAAVDLIDAPTSTALPGEAPVSLADWKYRTEQGMLKSGQDEREYRWLALSNGLKVLLVHDSKVSRCCLLTSRYFTLQATSKCHCGAYMLAPQCALRSALVDNTCLTSYYAPLLCRLTKQQLQCQLTQELLGIQLRCQA